jgi:hypothetical protein
MAAQSQLRRRLLILFLPAACVLAFAYATFERPADERKPNELPPAGVASGVFVPHTPLATPAVAGTEGGRGAQTPDAIDHQAVQNALEARRLLQPDLPIGRPSRR